MIKCLRLVLLIFAPLILRICPNPNVQVVSFLSPTMEKSIMNVLQTNHQVDWKNLGVEQAETLVLIHPNGVIAMTIALTDMGNGKKDCN